MFSVACCYIFLLHFYTCILNCPNSLCITRPHPSTGAVGLGILGDSSRLSAGPEKTVMRGGWTPSPPAESEYPLAFTEKKQ